MGRDDDAAAAGQAVDPVERVMRMAEDDLILLVPVGESVPVDEHVAAQVSVLGGEGGTRQLGALASRTSSADQDRNAP